MKRFYVGNRCWEIDENDGFAYPLVPDGSRYDKRFHFEAPLLQDNVRYDNPQNFGPQDAAEQLLAKLVADFPDLNFSIGSEVSYNRFCTIEMRSIKIDGVKEFINVGDWLYACLISGDDYAYRSVKADVDMFKSSATPKKPRK